MTSARLRPRFTLRTLAILVAIFSCGLWWVTWPRQVASRVAHLLNERKFKDLAPQLASDDDREFLQLLEYLAKDAPPVDDNMFTVSPRARTWRDILRGRQEFILAFHFEIIVERGAVSIAGSDTMRGALRQKIESDRRAKELFDRYPELKPK